MLFFVIIDFVARCGELSERSKEPVLKTGDVKASVGSNPTLSSKFNNEYGLPECCLGSSILRQPILIYGEVLKRPKRRPC